MCTRWLQAKTHLSDAHVTYMLGRSRPVDGGKRDFYIGSGGDHVDPQHKIELIKAFGVITEGVFKLLPEWGKLSKNYCSAELEKRYAVVV
jgi:hypothetical protein